MKGKILINLLNFTLCKKNITMSVTKAEKEPKKLKVGNRKITIHNYLGVDQKIGESDF